MSDAFDVPTEILDVTIVGPLPLPVTGTITTSPDVNIHDSTGGTLTSTGTSLNVNVTDFPAIQTVAISQTGTDNNVDANITNVSLAVIGPLTDAQLRATPVPISGTITTTPSGTQDVNIVSTIPVPVTDNGGSLTVDGTVAVSNFPAVQPVSGPLTDTQLRASPVSVTIPTPVPVTDNGGSLTVDGTVAATQGTSPWVVSGTVIATPTGTQDVNIVSTISLPVTGPLTDTQLRATPVPISGTVAVNNFPATQPVSGTVAVTQSTSPWVVSGTVTANLGTIDGVATAALQTQPGVDIGDVTINNTAGASAVNIQDGGNSITVDGTITSTFSTSSLANGAETAVSSSAVQVLAANASRKFAVIQNTGVANVRIGITGVTATTGLALVPDGSLVLEMPYCATNAIFAIREGAVDSVVFAFEAV